MLRLSVYALAAASSLASTAFGRIQQLYVPSTVAAGSDVEVMLGSAGYIQSVFDVSTAYGVGADLYTNTLGGVSNAYFLGEDQSNQGNTNITQTVTIPDSLESGSEVDIGVALTSVYGASGGPVIQYSKATVTVGEETSDDYVAGDGFSTICS